MKRDGHVHTPFCPHGTKDTLEEYIETALLLGIEEISFTEHAPLPAGFTDTTPEKDSAMEIEQLDDYFSEIERVKKLYQGKIFIHTGLEIDYIEGYEKETRKFLDQFGFLLDDAVLSVHFLKHEDSYYCLDYSPQYFAKMIEIFGSAEAVYQRYYETVRMSVISDLGHYKPKRIGHLSLVHKFQNRFPFHGDEKIIVLDILNKISEKGYEIDYNGAGTAKPLCREPYPPDWMIEIAKKKHIPLVYGSDAHQAKELGQGFEQLLL
nr:histidinol-phosphatase HisJ [uncultured Bacillus sp.]